MIECMNFYLIDLTRCVISLQREDLKISDLKEKI